MEQLPSPSDEQLSVIKALIKKRNVIVDSVAGSGKTTTVMHAAMQMPNTEFLLLTYNAKLKLESRQRAEHLQLHNLEIHSYHAFAVKYYHDKCFNDEALYSVIEHDVKPKRKIKYDIIVIDEAQDMVYEYYKLVLKIVKDFDIRPQICLVGDVYQNIYSFKGADERFMTLAPSIFKFNQFDWEYLKLSTSYRITNQMAAFLNNCVLQNNRIKAVKNGVPVDYAVLDIHRPGSIINKVIMPLLGQYKYEDIFLLNSSIKSPKSPVAKVTNMLSNQFKIPIYAPISEDELIRDDVIKGKMVVSTFHQTKGLERKVVIVFGFDSFYYNYGNNKDKSKDRCPNDLYVALTRAKEKLVVLHNCKNDYMPFMDSESLSDHVNFVGTAKVKKGETNSSKSNGMAVTQLVERLSPNVVKECMQHVKVRHIKEPDRFIDIPRTTKQGYLTENVAEINGTAIASYAELKTKGSMTIFENLKEIAMFNGQKVSKSGLIFQEELFRFFDKDIKTVGPGMLLQIANHYCANTSKYVHKVNQIKKYDWLSKEALDRAVNRVERNVSKEADYEIPVSLKFDAVQLEGFIDCVDTDRGNIWEFKCVDNLKNEHVLQLVVYSYMLDQYCKEMELGYDIAKIKLLLFNILSGEILKVYYDEEHFKEVLRILIAEKFKKEYKISDSEFIRKVLE